MPKSEIEDLKNKFVSHWISTPEHQKIFFMNELNKIRESSFHRTSLIEKLEPYKDNYKFKNESYNNTNKNVPKWIVGFYILSAIVDYFELIDVENVYFGIFGILIAILFLITMLSQYVELKSLEIKILNIEIEIDRFDKRQFFVSIDKDLYEEIGSESFDFYGLENDVSFQKLKLYLLSHIRNSSVFE